MPFTRRPTRRSCSPGSASARSLRAGAGARDAHATGLLVEDGLLTGVGDGPADRARSVLAMQGGEQQVRVMTLVPQEQTPLADVAGPGTWQEVLTIAVMRLLMPDRLIPASLDVEGIGGCEPP